MLPQTDDKPQQSIKEKCQTGDPASITDLPAPCNRAEQRAARKLKKYPAAYASAYTPTGPRRRYMVVYRCPYCESGHHGFVWDLDDATGPRTARCGGGSVWLVIARTYQPAPGEAAE